MTCQLLQATAAVLRGPRIQLQRLPGLAVWERPRPQRACATAGCLLSMDRRVAATSQLTSVRASYSSGREQRRRTEATDSHIHANVRRRSGAVLDSSQSISGLHIHW